MLDTTMLGKINRCVPRLGAGGHFTIGPTGHEDIERRVREIHHQIDAGMVYFDVQWEPEAIAMSKVWPDRKDDMVVAWPLHGITAQADGITADYVINYTHDFAKRFGIDYMDVALWIALETTPENQNRMVQEVSKAFEQLKAEGMCRHLGFSCHHSAAMALNAVQCFDAFELIMVPFGPLNPRAADELFPAAREKGVATVAMKPFGGGGGLFNAVRGGQVTNPQPQLGASAPYHAALRWVLNHDCLDCTVPGTSSVDEIDGLIAAAQQPFTDADEAVLEVYRDTLTTLDLESFLTGWL